VQIRIEKRLDRFGAREEKDLFTAKNKERVTYSEVEKNHKLNSPTKKVPLEKKVLRAANMEPDIFSLSFNFNHFTEGASAGGEGGEERGGKRGIRYSFARATEREKRRPHRTGKGVSCPRKRTQRKGAGHAGRIKKPAPKLIRKKQEDTQPLRTKKEIGLDPLKRKNSRAGPDSAGGNKKGQAIFFTGL